MWPFKKKNVYKVVYHFMCWYGQEKITDYIKASDPSSAAGKIQKKVGYWHVICVDSVEKID